MVRYIAKFQTSRLLSVRSTNDRGATAVEYGLMVALIAAVIMGVVAALGTSLMTIFTNATSMF